MSQNLTQGSIDFLLTTDKILVGNSSSRATEKTFGEVGVELVNNKVISFNSPTDTQYPSAKLVNDNLIMVDTNRTLLSAGVAGAIPTFTDNTNGTCNVGGCLVNLFPNADFSGKISQYSITGLTNIPVAEVTTTYVYGSYNGGVPIMAYGTDVNVINESTVVPIYTLNRIDNVIFANNWDSIGEGLSNKLHVKEVKTERWELESGIMLSEAPVRSVVIGSGSLYQGIVKKTLSSFSSGINRLIHYYPVTGVWTHSDITQYPNTQYSDGTNLLDLSGSNYAIIYVYRAILDGVSIAYCILGLGDNNLKQAQTLALIPPSTIPFIVSSTGYYVGYIIVKKSDNVATELKSVTGYTFSGSTAVDHESLLNLSGGNSVHYHSDQPINVLNSPEFADVNITSLPAWKTSTPKSVLSNINRLTSYVDGILVGSYTTVGTGGKYTTFKSFVENSNDKIGVLISNITEVSNSILSTDKKIFSFNKYNIAFFDFYCNLNGYSLSIENCDLSFVNNAGLFDFTTDTSKLRFQSTVNVVINSTTNNNNIIRQVSGDSTPINSNRLFTFDILNITINSNNINIGIAVSSSSESTIQNIYGNILNIYGSVVRSVLYIPNNFSVGYINDINCFGNSTSTIIGGIKCNNLKGETQIIQIGDASYSVLYNVKASNYKLRSDSIFFYGTSSSETLYISSLDCGTLNVLINTTNTIYISNFNITSINTSGVGATFYLSNGYLNNYTSVNKIYTTNVVINNLQLRNIVDGSKFSGGKINILTFLSGGGTDCSDVIFVGVSILSNLIDGSATKNIKYDLCIIGVLGDTKTVTINSTNTTLNNCTIYGNLVITGNNNKISHCFIGSVTPGTKTITINAGALKNTIIDCTTEAVIVDNGTGTQIGFPNTF